MLMRLLWSVAGPLVEGLLGELPAAPEPVDLVLPWPAWLPFWPFGTVLTLVLLAGTAFLALRFLRWLYGLVPVVQ